MRPRSQIQWRADPNFTRIKIARRDLVLHREIAALAPEILRSLSALGVAGAVAIATASPSWAAPVAPDTTAVRTAASNQLIDVQYHRRGYYGRGYGRGYYGRGYGRRYYGRGYYRRGYGYPYAGYAYPNYYPYAYPSPYLGFGFGWGGW